MGTALQGIEGAVGSIETVYREREGQGAVESSENWQGLCLDQGAGGHLIAPHCVAVIVLQQHHGLNYVSEHHHSHSKHG